MSGILVMDFISLFLIIGLNSAIQKGATYLLCLTIPLLWLNNIPGQLSLILTMTAYFASHLV